MTMEAPHETDPLLHKSVTRPAVPIHSHIPSDDFGNTPVYPIIMMIRAVSHLLCYCLPEHSQS